MGSKQIDLKEVPGIEVIQARLASIDPGLSVSAAGYDFDRSTYVLELSGQGGRVGSGFPENFLMTCATTRLLREAGILRNCRRN
jgi:hypothetical protein